jgi:hypothetical protein
MKKDWDWRCMGHVWVRREMCTEFWWGNLMQRDNLGDLGVDGNIIEWVRKVAVHLGYCTFSLRPVSTLVDITSNTFHKCTVTFRTQICRKCLRIKLNVFRPVSTHVDITSNTFHKCTVTFRT